MPHDAAAAALAEYMQRVDHGEAVDRARFLAAHPECGAALSDYLDFAEEFDAIVSPAPAEGEGEDEWLLAHSTTLSLCARQDGAWAPLPGEALGAYVLGEVQAEDPRWVRHAARLGEEEVALLLLRPSEDPLARERFLSEAGALRRALEGEPRVQQILEAGVLGQWRYLCTPPWPAADLLREMDTLRADLPRAAALLAAVAEALAQVHARGLVHGDLGPGQIWLGPPGSPAAILLTGVGLERLTGPAQRAPSLALSMSMSREPRYLAPEVVRGQGAAGPAADVYALGVVLYELLAGRPPFAGLTAVDTVLQIVHARPEPPGGDPALAALCQRAMHPEPARRPGAAELAKDLRGWRPEERAGARRLADWVGRLLRLRRPAR